MKSILLLLLLCLTVLAGKAQNQPEQNCINGIVLCQSIYSQNNTYTGPGTIVELNSTNQGCLGTGENNCVWYIIQVSAAGQLSFNLTPSSLSDDYDFAIWDITANGCQDIYNGGSPIACNFSASPGVTGLTTNPLLGTQWSYALTVTAGQVLALNVSNYSQASQSSYVLDFTPSTASISDTIPPRFSSTYVHCGPPSDSVDVRMTEPVKCSSIQTNGSNFSLLSGTPGTGLPPGTTIIAATGLNCTSATSLTRDIRLKFSTVLPAGTYRLKAKLGTSGTALQDGCGNNMATGFTSDSVTFMMMNNLRRIYVDSSVAVSGSGASWASPMKSVSQALNVANATCTEEIWVRKGTYYPMMSTTAVASSRDSSFRFLRNGIKIYGGFAGTETVLSARNVTSNPTILSGDIGIIGTRADNSYHVITSVSDNIIDTNTRLDGFTIKGGNANGSTSFVLRGKILSPSAGGGMYTDSASLRIANCTFTSNKSAVTGGGMYNNNMAAPSITDCTFSFDSSGFGGAMYNELGASPIITSCIFNANRGSTSGGSLYNAFGTAPVITACIFTADSSGTGGSIYNYYSYNISITNCVFYANKSLLGGAIFNHYSSSSIITNTTFVNNYSSGGGSVLYNNSPSGFQFLNCILWGNYNAAAMVANASGSTSLSFSYCTADNSVNGGTGNSMADPLFLNAANAIGPDGIWRTSDDGLRLTPCSEAINTGSNASVPYNITTDINNVARIQNTTIDRGAYEMPYNSTGLPSTTVLKSGGNPVCPTTSVTFNANTIAPGSLPVYQWYKNSIAVGINQNTYTFNSWSNGDSVWVVHRNNDCNLNDTSNKNYIQVPPVLAQPGTITGNTGPCPGTQIYSIATVPNAITYTWVVPAGWVINTGQGTSSITVTSTSTAGNITVTANNSCAVASMVRTLAVTPLATTIPTPISGPVAVCASSVGNVYSIPAVAGATTYAWTVPAAWIITAGQGTPSITATAPSGNTNGTVTVTAANSCQTSDTVTLAVNAGTSIAPMVAISKSAGDTICLSTPVTFTATPTIGGTAPVYQWKNNGVNVGTNSATYSSSTLANGDVISVVLTSNSTCASVSTATATSPAMTVIPTVTPAIIINGASPLVLCAGTSNTFTATSSNGGAAPAYQWYNNGTAITGANASTYTGSAFANEDSISVVLTSTAACRLVDTVHSNAIKLTVYPNVVPVVMVTVDPALPAPIGTTLTFTANVTATGPVPTYQWYLNGIAIAGAQDSIYSTSTLQNGDLIWVRIDSLGPCASPDSLTSAPLRISDPVGVPTVSRGSSWKESLILHPNPNTGRFTVTADWGIISAGERVHVSIVNNMGQRIFKEEVALKEAKWHFEIQLSAQVANGLYMLQLQRESDGSSTTKPVLIQR